jgi:hypothetical protein
MRVSRFLFTLAAIVLITPGWALGGDQEIAQEIISRLGQEKQTGGLKGFNIDLEVEDGTVWVSGRVASAEQQQLALNTARAVPGVTQVVNDLTITPSSAGSSKSVLSGINTAMKSALWSKGSEEGAIQKTQAESPLNAPATIPQIGSGLSRVPTSRPASIPQAAMPTPAPRMNQTPVAYAAATTINRQEGAAYSGQPVPIYGPGSGVGVTPARYDHPSMPNYSWPSYASHPNYAAVTYPKQYSASTWPYIGPFYPYPQVPLGWRKVTLEWDDGWWMLDFKDHRHR